MRVIDINELQERIDHVAQEIAERIESQEIQEVAQKHSLVKLLRRALAATVDDSFAAPGRKLARPRYNGVRIDGNPIAFLLRHYKYVVENNEFYQADLARLDPRLLDALRNASKSKYWGKTVQEAEQELTELSRMGALKTDAHLISGMPVGRAIELADILPPRKNLGHSPTKRRPSPDVDTMAADSWHAD